ncbi:MAG: hypothetical protein IJZ39_08255 [Oscillospiraceae bacterium]|nr:hypothetical protein [Oscillospiraceae bacterium]
MAEYMIQEETLTGIADQVRRLADTDGLLTPAGMEAALQGIESSGATDNAEDYLFGASDDVTEYAVTGISGIETGNQDTRYLGWKFKVLSEFSVRGFRMMNNAMSTYESFEPKLYRVSDRTLIASASVTCPDTAAVDVWLDAPVNLTVGETYAVYVKNNYTPYLNWSSITLNSKISKVTGIAIETYTNPTVQEILADVGSSLYGVVFPIMGEPVDTDIPTEYSIQLSTMNDIAAQVQRLGGITGQISTNQMINVLQGTSVLPFPAIPTDIVGNCPYVAIMNFQDTASVNTWVYGSVSKPYFHVTADGDRLAFPSGRYRAMLNSETNKWGTIAVGTTGTGCLLTSGWEIIWTNFDVPNGSVDAAAVYYSAGSFVPAL